MNPSFSSSKRQATPPLPYPGGLSGLCISFNFLFLATIDLTIGRRTTPMPTTRTSGQPTAFPKHSPVCKSALTSIIEPGENTALVKIGKGQTLGLPAGEYQYNVTTKNDICSTTIYVISYTGLQSKIQTYIFHFFCVKIASQPIVACLKLSFADRFLITNKRICIGKA